MNTKIYVLVMCVEGIIYLLLYNLYDCTFNQSMFFWHYITQGEYMFLCLCEYSEFNHTSTSMIFFTTIHMLKQIRK